MPNLKLIQKIISAHQPEALEIDAKRAAVAMILRGREAEVEMLMLRRAEHAGDPWSGDLGFPGGKIEFADQSAKAAAEREVHEEIGLRLTEESFLGQLNDITGAYLPVNIACFAYHLDSPTDFDLNHEISNYWWVPLARFLEPERHRNATFTYRNQQRSHPVIDLVEAGHPFLWGITYRLVEQFFTLIGHPLPTPTNFD